MSPMRRLLPLLILLFVACDNDGETLDKPGRGGFRKNPISVRGWISEIAIGPPPADVFSVTDSGSRVSPYQARLFEETNMSIDDITYASGAVRDDGSFVILDAPPGDLVINFQAPGVSLVPIRLENIPGNADVFIPSMKLYPDRFELLEPDKILVRVPSRGSERKTTGQMAVVGGQAVEIWEVPLREMMDRRDFPVPN